MNGQVEMHFILLHKRCRKLSGFSLTIYFGGMCADKLHLARKSQTNGKALCLLYDLT